MGAEQEKTATKRVQTVAGHIRRLRNLMKPAGNGMVAIPYGELMKALDLIEAAHVEEVKHAVKMSVAGTVISVSDALTANAEPHPAPTMNFERFTGEGARLDARQAFITEVCNISRRCHECEFERDHNTTNGVDACFVHWLFSKINTNTNTKENAEHGKDGR